MKSCKTAIVLLAISLLIGACGRKEEAAAPVAAPASGPAAAPAEVPVAVPADTPAAEPSPSPAPDDEQLTIALEQTMKPWTGDLDGMIERRVVRILTVYSKTFYFVDKGVQRGSSYDMGRLFVEDLNKKLARDKKLKNENLKVHAAFIPVARGDLIPALVAGKGDIVIASFGVTAEREKLVDFSSPLVANVSEVVVSGPGSPAISSVVDLAGKQVFVRRSSTYYESLVALNRRFATEKRPAVIIKEAPETLEDEDLIEMTNAGLVPFIVVADFYADFWKQVFPAITVHKDITLRTGGSIA